MSTTETVVHSNDLVAGAVTVYRLRVDDLVYRVAFYAKSGVYISCILQNGETICTLTDWEPLKW